MMNRLNNILIGLLWLLASTLGATFWFNTIYGFNIFSAQHWQHLAYMQATGQTVKTSFYVSMVIITFIVVFGFYKLLQPRLRQITLPVIDSTPRPQTRVVETTTTVTTTQPVTPQPTPATPPEQPSPTVPARPPRLNVSPVARQANPVPRVPLMSHNDTHENHDTENAEIRTIFESAGYMYKGAPRIKNVQTAIVAIGTNEVLWMGAIGISVSDMQRAVQTLAGIFSDTLDDIEIKINAFIVAGPDADASSNDILQFASINDLRDYIARMPNTPPDADETENFDAYSGYIGTVMDYIGKI